MYEDRPYELLKEMAAKRVLVETNLTSNADILGVSGKDHPFTLYRTFGVPVALSTDDEGVARIDLTHEYVSAVETFGLSYADLKEIVRNSLEYSFLPGASLWGRSGRYAQVVELCRNDTLGAEKPSQPAQHFSPRARRPLSNGTSNGAFPSLRRAFESETRRGSYLSPIIGF